MLLLAIMDFRGAIYLRRPVVIEKFSSRSPYINRLLCKRLADEEKLEVGKMEGYLTERGRTHMF
jgi:hypothetical protein